MARLMPGSAGRADRTDPVELLPARPESILIDGLPFAPWFTGDDFPAAREAHIPVPPFGQKFSEGDLPVPAETVRIAIIGAGISGLSCAYFLRDHQPVLLDVHERFGGAARGERWAGTEYSLGNAYVIVPDKGSFLEELYTDLGLDDVFRLSIGDDPVAIDGTVLTDFWVNGFGGKPDEVPALAEYAAVVRYYAEEAYPEIPFEPRDREFVVGLDQRTLKEDIEQHMTLPVPPLLESAIQGYCFSSFGAGWERISAACGWNFLAAEEYGRWVFPGGTSFMARALWKKLRQGPPSIGPQARLRGGATIVDVRMRGEHVQVTWRDRAGILRSLLAERVVMACPKFVCKHVIHDLAALDAEKDDAMHVLQYTPYMVANVLLDAPLRQGFYDLFLMGDSAAPLGSYNPCGNPFDVDNSPVTDVVNGVYAIPGVPRSVLTMYWPLQCPTARYELVFNDPFERWAGRFTPQLDPILGLLGFTRENVVQIRLSRWGHAMPVAAPLLIANGTIEALRRPIADRIWFVNQDNWALPAVENSILDAKIMTDRIREGLV